MFYNIFKINVMKFTSFCFVGQPSWRCFPLLSDSGIAGEPTHHLYQRVYIESVHRSRSSRDIPTQLHVSGSPYKCVLGWGLFGASQDTNVTNGCLGGVTGNELDAKSPLPEGLFL